MLYTEQPKKMLIINILDILKKYTDSEHTLTQKEIIEKLEKEYQMKADRKSVKRNLMNLIDFGYDIEYDTISKTNKNGDEENINTNWYFNHEFNKSELRLLIDSLIFSKHIPNKQCIDLIEKLKSLSNIHFDAKAQYITRLQNEILPNKQLFLTIDILNDAIEKKKQVSFLYNDFDIDKNRYPKKDRDGDIIRYLINPYQMVAANGRYYLICNNDKHNDITHYRIDRITEIEIIENTIKPKPKNFNLQKHMAEHIYMFSGDSVRVTFKAKRNIINEIIDWFGKEVVFSNATDEYVDVNVTVNESAFFYWVLQYSLFIEVLEPTKLRQEIKKAINEVAKKY